MNWIVVKKFPLNKDLSHVAGFLNERSIAHRIYEESGEQILAVADPRMVGPIAQFLNEVEQGTLVIQHDITSSDPEASVAQPFIQQIFTSPITSILILLSALGALIVGLNENLGAMYWFTFQKISFGYFLTLEKSLQSGEIWRLVTPAFLHFGFLHFVFNSLWMWDMGRRLELYMGKSMYLLFFVATAVISNGAQYFWQPNTNFGGMSGVVYALVGFIIVNQRLAPSKLTAVPASVLGFMLFWLVLCMTGAVDYFVGGGVANAAHVGGLLAGAAFACLIVKKAAPQD
ncbi:MAG: rhomboid family intramembrane serine protease [Gammaproteobacteria bacterium]|nr:MAG: rhomboid family intramembrane serine protease [Gammaproteobacteria bacterium]